MQAKKYTLIKTSKIIMVIRWHTSVVLSVSGVQIQLELVSCKKQPKKFLTSYWFAEYETSEGPE